MDPHTLKPGSSSSSSAGGTTVLRSFDELEALREAWLRTEWPRVDADPEFFRAVVESRPEVLAPYVLALESHTDPAVVAVARLEDVELPCRVGYRALWSPRMRVITVVPGGVASGADAQVVVAALQQRLVSGDAEAVCLPGLREDSPLFREATRAGPTHRRGHLASLAAHWRLDLPESYDEFLRSRSRKARENARMYRNRLARDHGEIEFATFRDGSELDRLFADIGVVAERTYQQGLGVAFADTAERRRLTELGLRRGWFRAYLLYVRGEPVAFWQGYAYGGTFFTGTPGYDPNFADYSVGTLVLLRMIEDLIDDPAVGAVDYGFGDADYKRRFGSESWPEADVWLFAPTIRAVAVNGARTAAAGANLVAKRLLERGGLAAKVKKHWRARLARRA